MTMREFQVCYIDQLNFPFGFSEIHLKKRTGDITAYYFIIMTFSFKVYF